MKKIQLIEQISPEAPPYKTIYYFDSKTNNYIKGSTRPLSKKERDFYQDPEVNKHVVKHLWLDSPNRLEKSLNEHKANLSAHHPDEILEKHDDGLSNKLEN